MGLIGLAVGDGVQRVSCRRRREERDQEAREVPLAPLVVVDAAAFILERLDVLLDDISSVQYREVLNLQLRACLAVSKGVPPRTLEMLRRAAVTRYLARQEAGGVGGSGGSAQFSFLYHHEALVSQDIAIWTPDSPDNLLLNFEDMFPANLLIDFPKLLDKTFKVGDK